MQNLMHTGGWAITFFTLFTNWKSCRRSITVPLELTGKISSPGVLISELADYFIMVYTLSHLSCSKKGTHLLYIKTVLL